MNREEGMRELREIRARLDRIEALMADEPAELAHNPRAVIAGIQRLVARRFGLTAGELLARDNSRRVSWPRQIAMAMSRKHARASEERLAKEFKRGKGAVHHACIALANQVAINAQDARAVAVIEAEIVKVLGFSEPAMERRESAG